MSRKGNPSKVHPAMADRAFEIEKDRGKCYSRCVVLSFNWRGSLAPGFDNRDLQAYYDMKGIPREH